MLHDLTNWWNALGGAEQVFWAISLISNTLFVAYVLVQWTGGHDSDWHPEHIDTDFAILSVRSLLAFFMFMGWTGVIVLRQNGSVLLAVATGVLAGWLAAWLAYRLFRLLMRWWLKIGRAHV